MGVIGLWGLLDPAGKPVPLESLENKILAVDVSIWLNQAVKGYRDKSGNAVTNAHLLGLFQRITKLLFYKIKPVFVFDGKAPELKKETLQRRRIRKGDASKKSRLASAKILDNYVRSQAVAAQLKQQTQVMAKVLSKGQDGLAEALNSRTQKKDKDLFELPPLPEAKATLNSSDEDSGDEEFREDLLRQLNATDIHSMDVSSREFKSLPKDLQYEVLSELTERRKQSSWNRMHEMPKASNNFSTFQMQRLINRSRVQKAKDNVGKEIGDENALAVDTSLFVGDIEGIKKAKAEAKKVASSSTGSHVLYVKDLKKVEDNEIQILETTMSSSNRTGGLPLIKEEPIEIDEDSELSQQEILSVIQSNVQTSPQPGPSSSFVVQSSSSEDDDGFEEVSDGEPIDIEIQATPSGNFSEGDDLFADVFGGPQKPDESVKKTEENKEVDIEDPTVNMAEKMKQSEHLYLKIASKYMEPKENGSNDNIEEEIEEEKEDLFDELDYETDKLLTEMKTKEKEDRLLKIKDLDKLQSEETKFLKKKEAASKDAPTKNVLKNLGVEQVDQTDFEAQVAKEIGDKPIDTEVYGNAVEGFVRSSKDVNVQDLDDSTIPSEEILEKLNTEGGEEFSRDELLELQEKLAQEQEGLIAQRGQLDRLAATITDQMYCECQELLQLFGIPWIVAPSEAEAQCAFLDMNNLTHGTITDDSDVWVFGGQRVYKNFFNQDKHCEFFTALDVANHFGLSREKLILLAMMTGSDYTDGIESVGPVTALEILAEFPGQGLEPLKNFKIWWDEYHKNHAMPPGSKLREKLRKLQVPGNFPSDRISGAYMNPKVDNSLEKFSWAIPNFVDIRDYATEKFGWNRGKLDEMMKPVIKKMSVKISQERIDNFFLTSRISLPEKGHYQASKRVKEAISKVLGKSEPESKKRKTAVKEPKKPKESNKLKEPQVSKPPVDWKKEDELKKLEAKKKALQVLKSTAASKKKKKHQLKRKVLASHNLSESDSD